MVALFCVTLVLAAVAAGIFAKNLLFETWRDCVLAYLKSLGFQLVFSILFGIQAFVLCLVFGFLGFSALSGFRGK